MKHIPVVRSLMMVVPICFLLSLLTTFVKGEERHPQGLVAFLSDREHVGHNKLYVMDIGTGTVRRLSGMIVRDYAWSPDGKEVAFTTEVSTPQLRMKLYVQGVTDEVPRDLTNARYYWHIARPAWSPDGTQIAFYGVEREGEPAALFLVATDSAAHRRCVGDPPLLPERVFAPSWSDDGAQLVFNAFDRSSRSDHIFVINTANCSDLQRLTSEGDNLGPAWSPDGKQIAFNRRVSLPPLESYKLYVMNSDGSGQTMLAKEVNVYPWSSPVWSPDSLRIAFGVPHQPSADYGDIYVIDTDGKNLIQLTDTSGEFPGLISPWSPDGQHLAFTSRRDGNWEIYTMSATDGSRQTNQTRHPASDFNPQWSPYLLTEPRLLKQ